MKIADTITITIGGDTIPLHPSLGNAIRLERRPGSFASLINDVSGESLTAACEIIGGHLEITPHMQDAILNALPDLRPALLSYVMACAGIDTDEDPAANDNDGPKGKTVSFRDHLASLYRIGTGWLGWTPADTLDATPVEISEAYKGRLDMLKGIFGSGEDAPVRKSDMTLDDKMKMAIGGLKTLKIQRSKAG